MNGETQSSAEGADADFSAVRMDERSASSWRSGGPIRLLPAGREIELLGAVQLMNGLARGYAWIMGQEENRRLRNWRNPYQRCRVAGLIIAE